ncbi:hypothetical protein SAMN02745126_04106 [Enhydrobacter aerosaccus]|uniref:Restriction system protein Mrr-like N-terminal domain-containing protein n=1 Tax=Enhydrobacter aerosaccus TaxID=225324 RepID=A0A1T4RXH7_9HYPH|nr:hypothetical protein [Enhydrobacter aerosaccus]SKA20291.1 hypothetical protein SAMN02745126_04106 [Enhydrobacter aerosaccus]
MTVPPLSNAERAVLENLSAFGPERGLDPPIRGRLALYKLIDETPQGWKITPLGREVLAASKPQPEGTPSDAGAEEMASRTGDGERHYGRKSRNTSWLD